MLYEFLAAESGVFNLLNYITFRTGGAVMTAFLIALVFGSPIINGLRKSQGNGQPIRDLSFEDQMAKRGTPTMGGFIIWLGLFIAALLWSNLSNPYTWVILFVTGSFAVIGYLDDAAKVAKQTDAGVSARIRLLLEFLIAGVAVAFIMGLHGAHTPQGHAEWGPLNSVAQQIAALAPPTSVEPNDQAFSGGVAVPFLNNYFLP
ncbi:MAG: phospho-N-acetylmuramoyl-pentapeptide-transferase, partial [Pseudomonadota bacterium]